MKLTKKQIEKQVITLSRTTKNSYGKYQITVNGVTYNNYQGTSSRPNLVSFPEGNFDTELTTYPQYHLIPDTKKGFVTLINAIVNK